MPTLEAFVTIFLSSWHGSQADALRSIEWLDGFVLYGSIIQSTSFERSRILFETEHSGQIDEVVELVESDKVFLIVVQEVKLDGLSRVSTYFSEKLVGVVDCDVLEPRGTMSEKEFPHRDRLVAGVVY
ncbi:hypothetical protein V6N12_028874 [Hibiscus sabdariffa]|uniref:Uncharacterized protein n=1 Tax=Hibiscus sabdariffa TaxID=183260 RepID=A0ABR2F751_9ROSI